MNFLPSSERTGYGLPSLDYGNPQTVSQLSREKSQLRYYAIFLGDW